MSEFYRDYQEAVTSARKLAKACTHDVAIRAVKEYGVSGYRVAFACKNDSDYYRAEIIKPTDPQ